MLTHPSVNPDKNPDYQKLIDTMFAVNMSQSDCFYTVRHVTNNTAILCRRIEGYAPRDISQGKFSKLTRILEIALSEI